jgi:hypothetical protein
MRYRVLTVGSLVLVMVVTASTIMRSAQRQSPTCATGIILLPTNVNGRIEICGALSGQAPQLDRQLNEIVTALGAQRAELDRLIRGINGVGGGLGGDRQAKLLATLSSRLAAQQQAGQQEVQRQVAALAESVDALRDQLLQSLADRASSDKAREAMDGPVGDAIAELNFGSARQQLENITAQLQKIDAKVGDIQRTLDRQTWTLQNISSALVAGDTRFLQQLPTAQIPPSVFAEALSMPSGDTYASARFFENTRQSPSAMAWLNEAITNGLSPNLVVRGTAYRREALLNSALRAGNRPATELLLRRGASPHAYQELERTRFGDARFLFPLLHIARSDAFSLQDKRELVNAFVGAGVVIPAVLRPRGNRGWSGVMAAVAEQRELLERLGIAVAESPSCCTSESAKLCARFQAPGAAAWCQSLSKMPRYVTPATEGPNNLPLQSVELRYLLDITDNSAFFLGVEAETYDPDYVVVEVARDGSQWTVLKHRSAFSGLNGCNDQTASFSSTYCWKRVTLRKTANSNRLQADQDRLWIWEFLTPFPRR